MLVLTRKIEEEIILGNNIRVRVLSLRGNTVRIGIEAPGDVRIKRGELADVDAEPSAVTDIEIASVGIGRF